jgi:peptidoglycan/LPS O-acetylase OafA/YrhL
MGVPLFFVLSGFVLYYNYGDLEVDKRRFWTARFCRIYPIYLVAFLAAAAYAPAQAHDAYASIARVVQFGVLNILLLQAWHPSAATSWNAPSWSLSVETFFYLIFPALVVYISKRSTVWLRTLLFILCGVTFVIRGSSVWSRDFWTWTRYSPVAYLPMFILGAVVGAVFLRRGRSSISGAQMNLTIMSTVASILGLFAINRFIPPPLSAAIVTPLFALLIYSLAIGPSLVSSILEWPTMILLGEASYSVYILQEPWRFLAERIWPALASASLAGFAFYAVTLVLISVGTFIWIERPVRKWLRDRLQ